MRQRTRLDEGPFLPGHTPRPRNTDLITVCSACLRACCWQGEFYCDDYKTASTVQKTRTELRGLGREHPQYWKTDEVLAYGIPKRRKP